MMDYEEILEEATNIVEDASEISLSYFRQAILIESKADGTPVTIADKKTEEHIRRELERTFPGHGILGEEFGPKDLNAEFVWTIDPIDGTRSFISGIPLFGTLVGLLHRGEPVVGIMVLPALNETYMAAKDLGAYCDGVQLHVSQKSSLDAAFISVGDSSGFEAAGQKKMLHNLVDKVGTIRGYTDCFGHALVLRGAADAMVDPVVSIWDIAPLACLVEEAGGEYFSLQGEATIQGKSFVTCGPNLKHEILSLI
jgi:histidinol-phosphatase